MARPQRQGHGETRGAEQEDQGEGAGQNLAQHRSFEQTRHVGGGEVKRCRQPQSLAGNRLPAVQHEANREGKVEEDMGEDDPAETVDANSWQAHGCQGLVEQPALTKHRQQAQNRDNDGQHERRAHERHERPPAGELASCQCPGHRNRQRDADERRQECLQ